MSRSESVPKLDAKMPELDRRHPELRTFFYCIGAQKAATSWLHQRFAEAPDCHMAPATEMRFWDQVNLPSGNPHMVPGAARQRSAANRLVRRALRDPRRAPAASRAWRDARAYSALVRNPTLSGYGKFVMRGYSGQPVAGERSTYYARLDRTAFAQMARLHHNSRFLFILREPVSRLWSGIRHEFRLSGQADDEAAMLDAFAKTARGQACIHAELTDYRRTMCELEAAVPRDRILYLFYEHLFTPESLGALADFLGLERIEPRIEKRVNVGITTRTAPSPELRAEARLAFAAVYDFIAARFGDALPEAWQTA